MTQVNFHPKKSEINMYLPVSGIYRFSFVDADSGECIASSGSYQKICLNTSSNCLSSIENIFKSFIRGFCKGKNLALVIEMVHEKNELDLFD